MCGKLPHMETLSSPDNYSFHWFLISVKYFFPDSTSNFTKTWRNFDVFIRKMSNINIPILSSPKHVLIRNLFEFYFF